MTFKISNRLKRSLAVAHKSVPEEKRLCIEISEVLWLYYLLKQQGPNSKDALKNMQAITFLHLLGSDVILRLCKFRDTDSRSLSFEQVAKKLQKKPSTRHRIQGLDTKIKEYLDLTTNLEKHRDTYIAHLSKRNRTHLRPLEFLPAIRMAVEISDSLCGEKNSYRVLNLDLRADILGNDA